MTLPLASLFEVPMLLGTALLVPTLAPAFAPALAPLAVALWFLG